MTDSQLKELFSAVKILRDLGVIDMHYKANWFGYGEQWTREKEDIEVNVISNGSTSNGIHMWGDLVENLEKMVEGEKDNG